MFRTVCCFVCFAIASVVWAQDDTAQAKADAPSLAEQVRQLVDQLNADSAENRQTAENKLVELGPGVLEELPTETNRLPQETKSRLGRVRDRLEKEASKIATQASVITLKGKHALSDILDKLQESTGNRVIDYRNQNDRLRMIWR